MIGSSYTIYNASAGAGKTYTLVKNFLTLLLRNENPEAIRSILAVTFTNKAANEMKNRILTWLYDFSRSQDYAFNPTLKQIASELDIDVKTVHERSRKSLSYILHHYSLLSVSTIDKFNLRLMKSFTKELGLSYSFSIELDASEYLKQSIDELIDELGTDSPFAEVILNYIFWKFETETSTDIRKDLLLSSQNFLKEINLDKITSITQKEIKDFEKLNNLLIKRIRTNKETARQLAGNIVLLMEKKGVQSSDFYQGDRGMGGFFYKVINESKLTFSSKNYKVFCEKEKFTSSKTQRESEVKEIAPIMIQAFYEIRELVNRIKIDESVRENLITIELQSEITRFLTHKKEENDILFLSDVNPIISRHLKDEPVAFIYEKLGGRYNHYFIDEFQDTSELQWNNFLPLIENARVSNGTTITLVGDPKQAIYRFRSGKPEILINLISSAEEQNIKVITLPENYRSFPNIVQFNNNLYEYLADWELYDPQYKELFGIKALQKPVLGEGGRVQISYIPPEDEERSYLAERVLEIVKECLENGFDFRDIALLVRNKKHSFPIVDLLIAQGIPVLTEEALQISTTTSVQTIIHALRWLSNPDDLEQLVFMLYQLWEHKKIKFEDFTKEVLEIKKLPFPDIISVLEKQYSVKLRYEQIHNLSFYDFTEELITSLGFGEKEEVYISALLDMILTLEKSGMITIKEFLDHWELQGVKVSVRFPDNMNSVQIMTVHKSKGLEFPVVIYPMISSGYSRDEYWFPLDDKLYNGFDKFYASGKTGLEEADEGIDKVVEDKSLERLVGELCVQYVATTRASQQLFLLEEQKEKTESYLQKFLLKNHIEPSGIIELFPKAQKTKIRQEQSLNTLEEKITWNSSPWNEKIRVSTEVRRFYSEENRQIQYGNAIHTLLSEIKIRDSLPLVMKKAVLSGLITEEQKDEVQMMIQKVLDFPELKKYFSENAEVYTEREILFEGRFYRPDRLVEVNGKFSIIDFKTGEKLARHPKQVEVYEQALQSFGKVISEKILVYIHKEGKIEVERWE